MKTFFAFAGKEFRQILRDHRSVAFLFVLPLVLLILFGFAVTNDIREAKFAVFDNAKDGLSRGAALRLDASEYFDLIGAAATCEHADRLLTEGAAKCVIVFPEKIEEKAVRGERAQIGIVIDACNPNEAANLSNYASAIIEGECVRTIGNRTQTPQIGIDVSMLFNPQLKSAYDFVPGVMGLILFLICTLMTSVGIVREKETGTMEILLVSPVRPIYIVVAKAVPYFVLSILIVAVSILLANTVLGVPIRGSITLLFGISTLYTLLALNIGVAISAIANTQQTAMFVSTAVFMLPTVLLSGMVFPVENMPTILQCAAQIVPAKWYISALRDIMLKGAGMETVGLNVAVMAAMALVFSAVAVARFKTRLD